MKNIEDLEGADKETFKEFFMKYYSPLCEYSSRYLSDSESEELVQNFMVYLWENIDKLPTEGSLKAYLFCSVKNRCLNVLRNSNNRSRIHNVLFDKLKDQFDDPDSYMVNELATNIEKSIDELPESYKEVFTLSRFEDLTNAQIAQRLDVSIKTIEYRITQSLKILRVRLKDYLPLLSFLFLQD